ncbi:MAG TPA: hypothetical protein PL066_00270 [bacterium]|nr:hypothetical protein [bacterium]
MSKQIEFFQFLQNTPVSEMEHTINQWLMEKGESVAIVHSQCSENDVHLVFSLIYHAKPAEKQKTNPKLVKMFRAPVACQDLKNEMNNWFKGYGKDIEVNRCLQTSTEQHITLLIIYRSSRNKIG